MKLPVEMQPGETVTGVFRRHWLYVWPKLVGMAAIAILVPVGLLILVGKTADLGGTGGKIAIIVAIVWFLFWVVRTYFTWYRYEHDIWIITNQRLIDSLKRNWFHHQLASADLVNVVDISTQRSGILATSFNFGDVRCETAGERSHFILDGIPKPSELLGLIDRARDAARRDAMLNQGPTPGSNPGARL